MRVAIAGVSHFHTHYFVEEFTARPNDELVGLSDPAIEYAEKWSAETGVAAFADYRTMCEATRPDLVFVFGRPDELAETAEYLIRAGIPSVIEKPVGINLAEIERVRAAVDEVGTFTTVPFALRYGLLARKIRELEGEDAITYASFRVLSGLPDRYVGWGLDWNLDPAQCGGGSTLNIGSQYFDLIRYLSPSATWQVKGAVMSSRLSGIQVEDYSVVVLESDGRTAVLETGYDIPNGMEVSVSICAGSRVFRLNAAGQLRIRDHDGNEETFDSAITQSGWYPLFIDDTVRRVQEGRPPAITIDDMLAAAKITESAYRIAGYDECMREPARV
jgi:predicted dehydrogenase